MSGTTGEVPQPRPRRLGRISAQAAEAYQNATPEAAEEIVAILDAIESGSDEAWSSLPMLPSVTYVGCVCVLMTNGDVLIWQPYGDYPHLYKLVFIGRP